MYVTCERCGRVRDGEVRTLGIEEDLYGRDVLTFRCKKCERLLGRTDQKSLIFNEPGDANFYRTVRGSKC